MTARASSRRGILAGAMALPVAALPAGAAPAVTASPSSSPAATAGADRRLLRLCARYLQNAEEQEAAGAPWYGVVGDTPPEVGDELGRLYGEEVCLCAMIARIPAKTLPGLVAKARCARRHMDTDLQGNPLPEDVDFLAHLALLDLERLLGAGVAGVTP